MLAKTFFLESADLRRFTRFASNSSVSHYVTHMKKGRGGAADRIRKKMTKMAKEELTKSAHDICSFAQLLVKREDYFEAILFFQIALTNFEKIENKLKAFRLFLDCIHGLWTCIFEQYRDNQAFKNMIKSHLIPWINRSLSLIPKVSKSEKSIALARSLVITLEGTIYFEMKELNQSKFLLKKSIQLLENHYGLNAASISNYAVSFYCIAMICLIEGNRDAKHYAFRGITNLKKARDVCGLVKDDMLEQCERAVELVNNSEQKRTMYGRN